MLAGIVTGVVKFEIHVVIFLYNLYLKDSSG